MIIPVNGHLVIEPVSHETFMASSQETYQEIGTVIATPRDMDIMSERPVNVGDKVYFDSWMAAKFPGSTPDTFVWLVNWEDVRAIEHAESSLPE